MSQPREADTTPTFGTVKAKTPIFLHPLRQEFRLPRLFLLLRELTLGRSKRTIDAELPDELVDLAMLPASSVAVA
jgi:hypothetical protein